MGQGTLARPLSSGQRERQRQGEKERSRDSGIRQQDRQTSRDPQQLSPLAGPARPPTSPEGLASAPQPPAPPPGSPAGAPTAGCARHHLAPPLAALEPALSPPPGLYSGVTMPPQGAIVGKGPLVPNRCLGNVPNLTLTTTSTLGTLPHGQMTACRGSEGLFTSLSPSLGVEAGIKPTCSLHPPVSLSQG